MDDRGGYCLPRLVASIMESCIAVKVPRNHSGSDARVFQQACDIVDSSVERLHHHQGVPLHVIYQDGGVRTTVQQGREDVDGTNAMKSGKPTSGCIHVRTLLVQQPHRQWQASHHTSSYVQGRVVVPAHVIDPLRVGFHPLPQLLLGHVKKVKRLLFCHRRHPFLASDYPPSSCACCRPVMLWWGFGVDCV